jgi:hypothetical protein
MVTLMTTTFWVVTGLPSTSRSRVPSWKRTNPSPERHSQLARLDGEKRSRARVTERALAGAASA